MISEDKRVLLLGAGASAASDFNLPTMAGFFDAELAEYPELISFLEWFYPQKLPAEYNLEEVLAYLDISRARMPVWGFGSREVSYGKEPLAYDLLIEFVQRRLDIPKGVCCSLHKRLFENLQPTDTILTLNYDLIADRALFEIEKDPEKGKIPQDSRMGKLQALLSELRIWAESPPSLIPREQETGFYIKLHGSLDWLYCPTVGCRNNTNLFAVEISAFPEQKEGNPCRFCGAAVKSFIIPPVATKRLEDRGRMAFLWNLALRELIQARCIGLIGLSLAPSDFELRWLLRQAVELRGQHSLSVEVVNKNENHRKQSRDVFPGNILSIVEYESIEDFLEY